MSRRELLKAAAALSAMAGLPKIAFANMAFAPRPSTWRTFEITTRVELLRADSAARAWIPLPVLRAGDWNRPGDITWTTNAASARIVRDDAGKDQMLLVEWKGGEPAPVVEMVSRVATRERAVDLSKPEKAEPLSPAERTRYLAGSRLVPIDGIIKETSDRIVGTATGEMDKAKLIYDWVVANTYRKAATRGCGSGDIVSMLKSGDLGGKCADINPLYVGLARAAGLPARDVYGLRVAPSKFGYQSLGTKTEIVTKTQHCRAEVYLSEFGWVPVDPADVRKVMLEETEGGLGTADPRVVAARQTLFGAWEDNWIAYNDRRDVALPGSTGPEIAFLMYPQAEIMSARLDCLDPDAFKYAIRSREITA
ncbi:transglutaminase-like domain-containing protein (plasmid) [Rhizobium sp. T1470]|uniref:transglutaminase-like domain-containing protein n=1 Tax=Rhizobium sp. T1470 TaxID=555320 RepID=UPI001AAE3522|nr:transglutaminase-like domain-containing protein [Rhizobium sp. T1473]MCA0804387.1 transglutaminase-like domain-containing protein [Rhizobium sp. T1473]